MVCVTLNVIMAAQEQAMSTRAKEAEVYHSRQWVAGGRVHPRWVTSPSQDHIKENGTNNCSCSRSLLKSVESPINLTCMFLD